MRNRPIALVLAITAGLLAVLAVIGYLGNRPEVGTVDVVEDGLTRSPSVATTTAPPGVDSPPQDDPAWAPNETSDLSRLIDTRGPSPVRLTIEALDIDAPIGAYGVDEQGLMDVPDNVTEVAWYRHGPRPGEEGSAVLAAHVDLRGPGRGLFFDLDRLAPGDEVVVTYEDGSTAGFEVLARSIYLKDELPLDAIFSRNGSPTLTLVTCGGGFSQSARSYDSNVVVYAAPSLPGRQDSSRE